MPFMVIYRTSDGSTRYEQSDAIDEAALFVERLRNSESSEEIRIFRMEEINFAFRPYYKVELGMPDRRANAAKPAAGAPAEVEVIATEPGPDAGAAPGSEPANGSTDIPPPPGADVDADGSRRGLFGR